MEITTVQLHNIDWNCLNGASFEIYINQANKSQANCSKAANASEPTKTTVESEFVSDAFQTSDKDLDEVKAGMKLLGIDSLTSQSSKKDGKITRNKIYINE